MFKLFAGARQMADGTLCYPRRGKPPELLEGYERDPGDDYKLLPVLPPCELRTEAVRPSNCGSCQDVMIQFCENAWPCGYRKCVDCIAEGKNIRSNTALVSS